MRLQQHNLKVAGNITGYFPLGRGRPPKSTDPRPLPPAGATGAAGDSAGAGATGAAGAAGAGAGAAGGAAHEPPTAIATVSAGFKTRNDHSGGYVRWNSRPNAKITERALNNLDGNGIGKVLLIVELGFLF